MEEAVRCQGCDVPKSSTVLIQSSSDTLQTHKMVGLFYVFIQDIDA